MAFSQTDLNAIAAAQAEHPSLPSGLLSAVATQETGGSANPDTAVSNTGATGLFQILPSTAANPGFGVAPLSGSLNDPTANANFAASYLQGLIGSTGSVAAAINSYSGGSYTLQQLEARNPSLAGAVGNQGVPSGQNGTAQQTAGNSGGSGSGVSSFLTPVWELMTRGAVVFFGIALVLVALIAMLLHSKTVTTPVSALTEHA